MEQKKYTLDKASLIKIGKGFLIAFGGFSLTYVLELIPQIDFGAYTPLVVTISSFVINAIKEYIKGK